MTIGNVDAAPLAAVPDEARGVGREGIPKPRTAGSAPAPGDHEHVVPPAATKRVALPEFPNYELSFRLDEERGRVVVQVIDSRSGEVVRTVPPDDLGRALRAVRGARGVLVDCET